MRWRSRRSSRGGKLPLKAAAFFATRVVSLVRLDISPDLLAGFQIPLERQEKSIALLFLVDTVLDKVVVLPLQWADGLFIHFFEVECVILVTHLVDWRLN